MRRASSDQSPVSVARTRRDPGYVFQDEGDEDVGSGDCEDCDDDDDDRANQDYEDADGALLSLCDS